MSRLSKWAATLTTAGALCAAGSVTATASAKAPSLRACNDWNNADAGIGRWVTSKSECTVLGNPGTRVLYVWGAQRTFGAGICVEGWGFANQDGRRVGKWFPLGCGAGGVRDVPWGVSAAMPKVRAKAQPGSSGTDYRWRYQL
jgi:hypothetical protein